MLARETLSAEHREIGEISASFLQLMLAPQPDMVALAAVRWRLNRTLMAHLTKEDRLLYPSLAGTSDAGLAALARRFALEMGGLADAYRAYMTAWSSDRIEAEWREFRQETRAILQALHRRIEREEQELYPRMGG